MFIFFSFDTTTCNTSAFHKSCPILACLSSTHHKCTPMHDTTPHLYHTSHAHHLAHLSPCIKHTPVLPPHLSPHTRTFHVSTQKYHITPTKLNKRENWSPAISYSFCENINNSKYHITNMWARTSQPPTIYCPPSGPCVPACILKLSMLQKH